MAFIAGIITGVVAYHILCDPKRRETVRAFIQNDDVKPDTKDTNGNNSDESKRGPGSKPSA